MNAKPFLPALGCAVIAIAFVAITAACSKLSPEAREIAGNYYIPEISADDILMELHPDATCVIRAVKPSLLTYSVSGTWNVEGDSLMAMLDPSTVQWEGDSSLIGEIAPRYTRRLVGHTDASLTVEKDGVQYVYHKRINL